MDDFFPDTVSITVCTLNTYFIFKHNVCPAVNYEMKLRSDGVLTADMPEAFKPLLRAIIPNVHFDQIQVCIGEW